MSTPAVASFTKSRYPNPTIRDCTDNDEATLTRKAIGANRRGRRDRAVLVHQRGGNDRRHDCRRNDLGHRD
jgi:hypothetical protein